MRVDESDIATAGVCNRRLAGVLRAGCVLIAAISAGCAGTRSMSPPAVPATLRPPADQVLLLRTYAKGVQIYQCVASAEQPTHFEWKFKQPEAQLSDRSGRTLATHYAGPTWKASDGSEVVGEVRAHEDAPSASAIAWLLLSAKSHAGSGVFSNVSSIQRLNTAGGKAPAEACGADNVEQLARVPYTAEYIFYVPKR